MAREKGRKKSPPLATLNDLSAHHGEIGPHRGWLVTAMLVILVVALLLIAVKPNELDVYKPVQELEFTDAALADCVQTLAAENGWSDAGNIRQLRCNNPSGDGIRSLEGIQHLVGLTDIDLAFNNIRDAAPIAELARLETVDLSHNSISEIPLLRSAPYLRRIELNFNQIESLDWLTAEHFLVLDSFSAAHNHLVDVSDIVSLASVRELRLRDNRIKDLRPIWHLQHLVVLDIGRNPVGDVSGIESLSGLIRLHVDRDGLESLDGIGELTKLEELDVSQNPLRSIAPIARLRNLQRLNLRGTGIESLTDVLSLGDLEVLRLSENPALTCEEIRLARLEYGEEAVRTDLQCPQPTNDS